MKPTTIDDLPEQTPAMVTSVLEPGVLGDRLMEMGLTPGTEVKVLRRGWLGGPIQLQLRGYVLSIRRAQGRMIRVHAPA